jgi:hypothetical protein
MKIRRYLIQANKATQNMYKLALLLVIALFATAHADDDISNIPGMERILPKTNLCKQLFATGFESWDDFTNQGFPITPAPAAGSVSAQNTDTKTSLTLSGTMYKSGSKSFQATSLGYGNDSHIAYPTVLFTKMNDIAQFTPIYVELQIYVEQAVPKGLWSTIATFANDYQNKRQISVNLDDSMMVSLYGVPFEYQQKWTYQNKNAIMPVGQWSNLTVYLDLNPLKGVAAVWINDALASVANVQNVNGGVYTANFGMYMSQWIGEGSIFNDDLKIWSVGATCKSVITSNGVDLIVSNGASLINMSGLLAAMILVVFTILF